MCFIGFMSGNLGGFRVIEQYSDSDYACIDLIRLCHTYSLINGIDINKLEYVFEKKIGGVDGFNVGIFKDTGGGLRFDIYEKFNNVTDAVIFTLKSNYSYSIVSDSDLESIKLEAGIYMQYEEDC